MAKVIVRFPGFNGAVQCQEHKGSDNVFHKERSHQDTTDSVQRPLLFREIGRNLLLGQTLTESEEGNAQEEQVVSGVDCNTKESRMSGSVCIVAFGCHDLIGAK